MTGKTQGVVVYPYYCFYQDNWESHYEGRFWNAQGKQIAIVAVVNPTDWAAYIGTDAPDSYREQDTCKWVAANGCKLSGRDAKHYFPDIKLPYRS